MIRLQEEQLELQDLDDNRRDVDRQLSAAEATTESLRAESLLVGQKPLADSTCLRRVVYISCLQQEREKHQTRETEVLRETLGSERHFLQSKLDGSRGSEQR
ncbi:hypothetical protein F2P81_020698 [Scophthalmus maximus]|uniref:Uncharacterized protein n=1 Tax=Scophthalmus maximus TaxID=52904 RepID=A0A6A4S4I3_SCOMX|nr:hypothetical protein F2P81_020698 [Scophthalmus maximus]